MLCNIYEVMFWRKLRARTVRRQTMGSQDFFGTSAYDSDPEIEETLVRLDPYIVASVEKMARHSSNIARPEEVDLEIDEITQRVRIKFCGALTENPIAYPRPSSRQI